MHPVRFDPWRVVGGVLGAVAITFLSWAGGCVTERYTVAEDLRREVSAIRAQSDSDHGILMALPVDDLKKLPAKVERIEAASDGTRNAVERMEALVLRRQRAVPAKGYVP